MLEEYAPHVAERRGLGIPPRPLDGAQARQVVDGLRRDRQEDLTYLLDLLVHRVSPGVGEAARVKAGFLADVARGEAVCPVIDEVRAVELLGTMQGGYNIPPLVEMLRDPVLGGAAADALGRIILALDAVEDVAAMARAGCRPAAAALRGWAEAAWLEGRPPVEDEIHLTVYKVEGETNTDDLSPATHAWSRADIPLHALSLLEARLGPGAAAAEIARLRAEGRPVAFVGDVVGTGSSRKSAVNSLMWHIGDDIPYVPGKRSGGVVIGGSIAPIFFDTLQDSGGLPIRCGAEAAARMSTGDHIVVKPRAGRIEYSHGELIGRFPSLDPMLLDAVRAGGRIPLIIGRRLAARAADALMPEPRAALPTGPRPGGAPGGAVGDPTAEAETGPYTLAQKVVGRACGRLGVGPGDYCEPTVSTVGSQDTTGPMNRSELEDLACLRFQADLVLQTFCHTAAYPKPADVVTQATLPEFMAARGAVVLKPGDGIIHSWLNHMLLPDQVGTGSDSHTRFPLGVSFPAGSGLVAFAAAFGFMPVTMPESVLVRFTGKRRPGITVRDLVNALPWAARRQGLLGRDAGNGGNVFSGRVIEIEGVDDLSVEQAFELTDSTAERSAAACTVRLSEETVAAHLRTSIEVLRGLVEAGYEGGRVLEQRIEAMDRWLREPVLLRADAGAGYAAEVEIDLDSVTEPLVACPNSPDDVRSLSEVSGAPVDEVFIGSCMTNAGHFRSAGALLRSAAGPVPVRLWLAPPTSSAERQLRQEGLYSVYGAAGARTEVPGCSLCMGNQARGSPGSTVVSTSTRNFPNRMGTDSRVYLASAEVATLAATLGRLPTVAEYLAGVGVGAA